MGGTPYLSESCVLMMKQIFMLRRKADRAFVIWNHCPILQRIIYTMFFPQTPTSECLLDVTTVGSA